MTYIHDASFDLRVIRLRQGLLVADLEKLNDGNAQKLKQQLGKTRKQVRNGS